MPSYTGADGATLFFDDSLDGEPIIVLAGGAARHPEYLGDLDFLGTDARRIVPHLRGVGQSPATSTDPTPHDHTAPDRPGSDRPDSDQPTPDQPDSDRPASDQPARDGAGSWWRQTDDVEALRNHLGLERLTLAAHSAGTRIAIAYAAAHPDRVERLVLLTPPAHYLVDEPSDVDALAARRVGEPEFDRAMALLAGDPDLASDEAFNEWQQATAPAGYAEWGPMEQAHSRVGAWNTVAVRAFFAGDAPTDLAERISTLEAPVLVVAGADDCLTGLNPVIALSKLFPNGRVSIIADCGHYPWVERPMELTATVTAFLEGTRDAAKASA
jgi:pimeloyl-ACP methyl ester carboxylesterase